jgi:5-(carboxyamino)imidazole ribonucleotide synthase
VTSQFENHLRAVLGWPLGSTEAVGHSAMLNFIGILPPAAAVLALRGAHYHDYGKAPRPNRKLGPCTLVDGNRESLGKRLEALRRLAERGEQ